MLTPDGRAGLELAAPADAQERPVTREPLYPLRFEPIFKSALWGGRQLAAMFPGAAADGPLAEAWVLSDQGDAVSRVADGPLRGRTLRELMRERGADLLGTAAEHHESFPLLLKFIDAREALSVQVHPDDDDAQTVAGVSRGKTEAWVVMSAEPGSRIFAGLRDGIGRDEFRRAVERDRVEDCLHSFPARVGDCVFIPAGTVHALGAGVMIFEVQQTSDVTYRLFDWGRVDPKTGLQRTLHIDDALRCTDFDVGPRRPSWPALEGSRSVRIERLVACPYFELRRVTGAEPFVVGTPGRSTILVGIDGRLDVRWRARTFRMKTGGVVLCPASAGECDCIPVGSATVLHCTPLD
jgi:mannose-6-phosphate isomerase